MIYFWFSFLVPFTQPFHISHFYMLLVLYAGLSVTDKNTMGLEFDTRKRRDKFLGLRIMEPQVSSICLLKFNFQMSLTVLNSHSEGWSLKSLCASVWKVSDTVLFCWTRLREKVAGFGILKTFLQLLLWGAVVPSCVATRAQYSVHFNSRRGFGCLVKIHSK